MLKWLKSELDKAGAYFDLKNQIVTRPPLIIWIALIAGILLIIALKLWYGSLTQSIS